MNVVFCSIWHLKSLMFTTISASSWKKWGKDLKKKQILVRKIMTNFKCVFLFLSNVFIFSSKTVQEEPHNRTQFMNHKWQLFICRLNYNYMFLLTDLIKVCFHGAVWKIEWFKWCFTLKTLKSLLILVSVVYYELLWPKNDLFLHFYWHILWLIHVRHIKMK